MNPAEQTDMKRTHLISIIIALSTINLLSCSYKRSTQEIRDLVKKEWDSRAFTGYLLAGRDSNIFHLLKVNCSKVDYSIRFLSESDSFTYKILKIGAAPLSICEIDLKDADVRRLIYFFRRLKNRSLVVELNSRANKFGVVQLTLGDESQVYYVKEYESLPNPAKEWLLKYSKNFNNEFFEVEDKEGNIWDFI